MNAQPRTVQTRLDPTVERTILHRTLQKSQPGTGLSVLLFTRTHRATPWIQIDETGHIVRVSVHFRNKKLVHTGDRIIGFVHPAVDTFDNVAVTIKEYVGGATVLGLQPVVYDGHIGLRLYDVIAATAGRSFPINPPAPSFPPVALP